MLFVIINWEFIKKKNKNGKNPMQQAIEKNKIFIIYTQNYIY